MSAGGGCLSLYIRRRRVASRSARRAVYNETQLWRAFLIPADTHQYACLDAAVRRHGTRRTAFSNCLEGGRRILRRLPGLRGGYDN